MADDQNPADERNAHFLAELAQNFDEIPAQAVAVEEFRPAIRPGGDKLQIFQSQNRNWEPT